MKMPHIRSHSKLGEVRYCLIFAIKLTTKIITMPPPKKRDERRSLGCKMAPMASLVYWFPLPMRAQTHYLWIRKVESSHYESLFKDVPDEEYDQAADEEYDEAAEEVDFLHVDDEIIQKR